MIFIIFIIFIFYLFLNQKEYFNNNIFKKEFLNLIKEINEEGEMNIGYEVNIISSVNKKYLEISLENVGFDRLNISSLYLKKLNEKNSFYIFNENNLYLNYDNNLDILNTKLINLDESNIFKIEEIEDTLFQLDYNKFRFICLLSNSNKYLGYNGLTDNKEKLYLDFIIS
jgi:hypothetical protein